MIRATLYFGLAMPLLTSSCGDSKKKIEIDAGPTIPAWQKGRESADIGIGGNRGLTPVRGIIHLHSPLSHDACDGKGIDEETGEPNEECLADLRAALCINRIDFAALTDHDDFMADQDFESTYLQRADDEIITEAGEPIASLIHCENGHEILWTVGSENDLMPVMLNRHPEGEIDARKLVYNANDAATSKAFRELGGLTFIAHTESKEIDLLRSLELDGLEIYNLHANLAPDIREEFLGLDGPAGLREALKYADDRDIGPEPDLALLGFLEPSTVALKKWDILLGEGLRLTGTAGTDAHQNALPLLFRDGERGDSYRRMIGWFSNIALVKTKGDPSAIQDALAVGRSYVAFELMGIPAGFDTRATATGLPTIELGGELSAKDGYTIEVTTPSVYKLDGVLDTPDIRVSIIHVDEQGSREIATGTQGTITATMDRPGAYRVEVYITPRHLVPYLGVLGPQHAEKEHPWIYSNPIYVTF